MTAPELKPCPFCGGEAETISLFPNDPHPGNTFVKCLSCMCATRRGHITSAIAAWNTRTDTIPDPMSDPRVVALIEAAQETWDQVCVNHDQPPPVKYIAPYGGLVKLHAALSAITKAP